MLVVKVVRQGTGFFITMPVSDFGAQYPGRAGAQKNANAIPAKRLNGFLDCFGETILLQCQLSQLVISAQMIG